MLVITEISEAVEADRKGVRANYEDFAKAMVDEYCFPPEARKELFQMNFSKYINGSVEEELADVVIRLLDFAGLRGIDLSNVPTTGCIDGSFIWQCYFLCEKICLYRYEGTLDEILIRNIISNVFCIANGMGINLLSHVRMKMKYNSMREYKHGKKY